MNRYLSVTYFPSVISVMLPCGSPEHAGCQTRTGVNDDIETDASRRLTRPLPAGDFILFVLLTPRECPSGRTMGR